MPRGDNNKGNPRKNAELCSGHTAKGEPCRNPAMPNGKCYKHGGATPKGPASTSFRHGRYSKALKGGLSDGYARARKDRNPVELGEEIAVVQAMLEQELAGLEDGGGPRHARRLRDELGRMNELNTLGDQEGAARVLNGIFRLIRSYASEYDRRAEARSLIEQRRKLAESERKRRLEDHEMWGRERVLGVIEAAMHLIAETVTDRRQVARVTDGLITLVKTTGLQEPDDPSTN